MNSETKICQNCKNQFTIEPDDFAFYEKMKVPAPTWCPECRLQRRMSFRNERILYRRNCDLCGRQIISMYSTDKPFPVYCPDCWWSDKWEAPRLDLEINSSNVLLSQFQKLQLKVPKLALTNSQSINSAYTHFATENKNCYLLFSAWRSEDCYYGTRVFTSKDCLDCYNIFDSNNCYECIDGERNSNLRWGQKCEDCIDSVLLFDCRGCSDCVACEGLRHKKFYFLNQPVEKNEIPLIKEHFLSDTQFRRETVEKWEKLKLSRPHKFANLVKTTNVIGDNVFNSKNCLHCFSLNRGEDSTRTFPGNDIKDSHDITYTDGSELVYDSMSLDHVYDVAFSSIVWGESRNVRYSANLLLSCSDCIFCDGLRNKQYCILNKQYTKEEYEALISRIIAHMNEMPYTDQKGRVYKYGEFFPPDLSPFCYNETIAQEYFPLTKEQATQQGYKWRDPEKRNYEITVMSNDLPDYIKDVKDDILNQVIGCAHEQKCNEQCTQAFKIIPEELTFYKRMNLPLPHFCPNCRHYQRIKQRNPLKLWHRKCQCGGQKSENGVYQNTVQHSHGSSRCPNSFETTYAPERKEIVYCEKCYQSEVV